MYRPSHQAQLGRGIPVPGRTRGSLDCGPRSWQVLVDARTHGRARPTLAALRSRGGVPGAVPTSVDDARRAIDGLPAGRGRTRLRYYRRRTVAAVRKAVRAGFPLHLCIDYGAFTDAQDGRTGDPRFRGGHSVAIVAERHEPGQPVEWLLHDSLDDARRRGIPQGPRWVARRDLVAAAVALGGGREAIWAGIVAGGNVK